MKIVHLLHEFPYPANSGVRGDMWRRLLTFKELGHSIFAVSWVSEGAGEIPSQLETTVVNDAVDEFETIVIGADIATKLRRLWHLRRYPSYIASRIPKSATLPALIERIRAFGPDAIWLEGVHPSWLGLELQRVLKIPLAYRSHNIEFHYLAEQAKLARSLRLKIALTLGTWGLQKAERQIHRKADHVYDISTDDLAYWRAEGFCQNSWLAPQPDPLISSDNVPHGDRDIDLLFVGSLVSPNNIEGLIWYLSKVHPRIVAAIPDVKTVIAGRKPAPNLAIAIANGGAILHADPKDLNPLFAKAGIMLNPILHGSGINIKTVDMLATGRPVLTTSKGARGLPPEVSKELDIADDPDHFADLAIATIGRTRGGQENIDRTTIMDTFFGAGAVRDALRRLGSAGK